MVQFPTTVVTTITPISGTKTVGVAGVRVALLLVSTIARKLTVQALTTNTGLIYVGGAAVDATHGEELAAGEATTITPDLGNQLDVALVYIDTSVGGNGVMFNYWV